MSSSAPRPDLGCDYYAASLHKWLGCPLGAGILYVRRELARKLDEGALGLTISDDANIERSARRIAWRIHSRRLPNAPDR